MKQFIVLFSFIFCLSQVAVAEEGISYRTLLIKPYGFKANDRSISGVSVDIFSEIERRRGNDNIVVQALPPKRIPSTLGTKKNYLIFPLTKNKTRSDFAQWVFHVNDATAEFVALKGTEFPETMVKLKLNELSDFKTFGVVRGSIFDRTLVSAKIDPKSLSYANSADQNFLKLLNKRVDYLFTSRSVTSELLKTDKFKGKEEEIEYSDIAVRAQIYIGGSIEFDPELLATVQSHLNAIKTDGTLDTILNKYSLIKPEALQGAKTLEN